MQRLKSQNSGQNCLTTHADVHSTFNIKPDFVSCPTLRKSQGSAHAAWSDATAAASRRGEGAFAIVAVKLTMPRDEADLLRTPRLERAP